uniref:Reverse transcriptase domain-containing protein n=1 Tax=Aegilops tauschii subsp. strangulata TaxID=200361 RepID=A0A453E573_AEGTS
MAVFNQFHSLSGANFARINNTFVTLLPKKDGAEGVGDFRPISLINSVAKLITKVLSMRLAEKM